MTTSLLSGWEAATLLGIAPWALVNYVHQHHINYELVEGRPYFVAEKLKSNGQPTSLVKIIEQKTSEEQEAPHSEDEMKTFTLTYIREHRIGPTNAIHSRFSNFNQEFRTKFPDSDPVTYTQQLRNQGIVVIRPCRGGALLFEQTPDLEEVLRHEKKIPPPAAESYDHPNKNIWREKWMEFLGKYLPITPETTVLFLPGPETLEVPGYDRLGISRARMIGVERHRKTAEKIHQRGLGIQVINDDLLHYLCTTTEHFDAVLLDYDGKITADKVEALKVLVKRQLLKERSCLGINIFGRREEDTSKMLYLNPFTVDEYQSFKESGLVAGDDVPEEVLQWKENYDGLRNYGLTGIVLRSLMGLDTVGINKSLLKKLSREEQREWEQQLHDHPAQTSVEYLKQNEQIRLQVMHALQKRTTLPLLGEKKCHKTLSRVALLLDTATSRPYFVDHHKRFIYATQNGTVNVFYSDFVALNQRTDEYHKAAKGILSPFLRGNHRVQHLLSSYNRLSEKEQDKVKKHIKKSLEALRIPYSTLFISKDSTPQRYWVGDIPTIPVPERVKREIVSLLQDNAADQHILRVFPEAQRSLPGIKAAYSQGKYTKNDNLIKTL